MSAVKVEIIGLEQILNRFANSRGIVAEEMEDAIDTAFSDMIKLLTAYPSPPPGSRYVRTYKLKAGWQQTDRRFVSNGTGLRAALSNPVDYAGLVQGDSQAAVHKGRWKPASQVQRESLRNSNQILTNGVERIAARLASG